MQKDYSNQDLRGKSFKGQNLTVVNFKGADIRGVNFKDATLIGADFSNAHAGFRSRSRFIWFIVSLILSFLTGCLWAFSGAFFIWAVDGVWYLPDVGGPQAFLSTVEDALKAFFSFAITISQTFLSFTIAICVFILLLITAVIAIRKRRFGNWVVTVAVTVAVTVTVSVAMGMAEGLAEAGAVAEAAAVGIGIAVGVAGAITGAVALITAMSVAKVLLIAGGLTGGLTMVWVWAMGRDTVLAFAGVLVGTVGIGTLSSYIAWRALKEDEQFTWIRTFSLSIASWGATNFQSADLTSANFHSAILRNSRFNKSSIIYRTCWQETQKLELANMKGTILENKAVRQLLVTGKGKDNSYEGLNLKGAYLAGADLTGADLREADLSGSTLENATVRNAHLARASVIDVEFKGADLTGACLESWNIDSTTHFEGAHAGYVYLLDNKQERRPASGSFGEGEFSKLFQEVLNTVDLIFKDGIDWQAFLYSFNKIREKVRVESDDAEISVQSIENKGDGVFVVRVNVPHEVDKADVETGFKEEYKERLALIKREYQAKLGGKEQAIAIYQKHNINLQKNNINLQKIISQLAEKQPIEVHTQAEAKFMPDERRQDIHAHDIIGSTINLGEISGVVTNTINQLPPSQNHDSPGLRELLTELQKLIESADEKQLKPEDKADALEEVKTLAEAGKETSPERKQKKEAQKSLDFIQKIASNLPSATKIAIELNKIIPEVSKLFGF
jgi:uncharacterized protein YjbI with pentapeptide repeats